MVLLSELMLLCSTVFMQANITITGNVQDVALVLSNRPWRSLDTIKTPNCGMVVIDESWLQPMTIPMVRSRMKASLVVSTRTNEKILYFMMRSNKKLNFPTYIVSIVNSKTGKARFTQVKFFNGYPFNYICKFACVASLAHNIRLIL